ncbi:hypothetical protein sscle_16g108540 [Sclerotinia sclerotiorum 1980 UF-70]|uniref:Uncharacterized protein n=1 Tax=Sclerotinia sclerotiorum (strain ATCC 18683 / 1980 / Ss-1) TaxID=665079 RepID=A0A1D9QMC4_SCLS1|nr:hypothetical protein sscle_16g108540 [Sclerotinia sclerotiorum 1980 UF-70]
MTSSYPSGSPGVPESSMPTGAPGFMPRRSSYASVVSGIAAGSSQQFGQPPRSGAFANLLNSNTHMLNQQHDSIYYDPNYNYATGRYGYGGFLGFDEENGNGGVNHGRSASWGRGGQLPSFSSAFGSLVNGHGHNGIAGHADHFFVPSYLKRSKYVQKLEEAHRAKVLAHRDGSSAPPSQPNSLSTSASSGNVHAKMVPSHRGRPYDLIEKSPLVEDETLSPLPSKWSTSDKFGALDVLSDGLEVKLTGPKSMNDRDNEASAIRTDHPMPPQCGIYYFEVTILSRKREDSSIGIGFSTKQVSISRLPGWEPDSWAYHGDDGHGYAGQNTGKPYGPSFTTDDTIGCGVNFSTGSAFFTKNGDHLGIAFRDIKGKLFPSVGMKKPGEHVRVNFGQSPFVYDIDGMISKEERQIKKEIASTSTSKLHPPLSETELIQALVLQFLTHDGYVETARAFADEVHSEKKALNMDPNVTIPGFDIKDDEDAAHRQRIRTAILEGDIDQALKHTNAYYPQVLKDNEHVYFRLRCRKFIEMVRQMAEMHNTNSTNGSQKNTAHNGDWYDDIINHDMELDDHQAQANNWDRMETDGVNFETEYQNLLSETLSYGQVLQAEFKDDPRREVSKALEDAFSLIAYKDPINEKTVSHLLDPSGRVAVAEELNSAILLSLGKSSSAALEKVYQQTTILLEDLRESGGPGAFVNIDDYTRPKMA